MNNGWRSLRNGAFPDREQLSALIMVAAMLMALITVNSAAAPFYFLIHHSPLHIGLGEFQISKPLIFWINEELIFFFFLMVGLEIKKEIRKDHISLANGVILPFVAAIGGIVAPVSIYLVLNLEAGADIRGWAIPMATDIVLVLGILAFLGKRVPVELKLFVASLAIYDDIGAVIVVAVFYGDGLALAPMIAIGASLICLWGFNRIGITFVPAYVILGLVMWVLFHMAGLEASLVGFLIAVFLPGRYLPKHDCCPVDETDRALKPWVSWFIVPVFAYFNAGVVLAQLTPDSLLHPAPVGVFFGLFVGKQIGVFVLSWLMLKLNFVQMPAQTTMLQFYGASILTGMGFTMSLFITSLAYPEAEAVDGIKLSILLASTCSAVLGYFILRFSSRSDDNSRLASPEEI